MSLKFWRRLRKWAQGKERDAYLERHCVNLKCPHCNTWASDAERDATFSNCGHEMATQYNCGQCNKPSYWVCEAGFWFQAEEWGIHIEAQQPRQSDGGTDV